MEMCNLGSGKIRTLCKSIRTTSLVLTLSLRPTILLPQQRVSRAHGQDITRRTLRLVRHPWLELCSHGWRHLALRTLWFPFLPEEGENVQKVFWMNQGEQR